VTFSYLELVVGFAGVAARARGDSFVSQSALLLSRSTLLATATDQPHFSHTWLRIALPPSNTPFFSAHKPSELISTI
jgi:hypothetical protein